MSGIIKALWRAAFPPLCVFCGEVADQNGVFCPRCAMRWENETNLRCQNCGEVIRLCRCIPDGAMGAVSAVYRLAPYYSGHTTAASALIFALKDRGERRCVNFAAKHLAAAIMRRISAEDARSFIVTNAPRRSAKIWKFGFDQSALVARATAKLLGAQYVGTMKNRSKCDQKDLSAAQRRENADSSYTLLSGAAGKLAGRSVIFIDDIITSGATTRACSACLHAAGARDVSAAFIGEGTRLSKAACEPL